MKVVAKHVLELKQGSILSPYEFDELDDGRYLYRHRTGLRFISEEEFKHALLTQEAPKIPKY